MKFDGHVNPSLINKNNVLLFIKLKSVVRIAWFALQHEQKCSVPVSCGRGGRGYSHVKGAGIIVSFRGVNNVFFYHLGVHDGKPVLLAIKVSFRVAREEIENTIISHTMF